MKTHLNEEMSKAAKSLLTKEDIATIAKRHKVKERTVVMIISGKRKAIPEIIDTVQDMCKIRHGLQGKVIESFNE